jgi:SAM-dependent methyltransferase/uncharacterized protein YbaR (Trm112 family)
MADDSKDRFLTFWNKVAKDYDEFVLSKDSPPEVRALEEAEDKFFDLILREHICSQKKTVFVEIGSGTGRYLTRCLEKVFADRAYNQFLSYIIGVDFSVKMIEKSIQNICSFLPKFAEIMKVDLPVAERRLKDRLLFINADAARPYLSVEGGALTLVGVMFGTLGNIPQTDHDAVLSRIKHLIDHGGEGIITVFNAREADIGQTTYRELDRLVGVDLNWDESTSTFSTSDKGFYSHWFDETTLIELLNRKKFNVIEIREIAKRGIGVRISTNSGRIRILGIRNKKPGGILLVCPICSSRLSPLPLPVEKRLIVCPHCSTRYPIKEIQGFDVPILFGEQR